MSQSVSESVSESINQSAGQYVFTYECGKASERGREGEEKENDIELTTGATFNVTVFKVPFHSTISYLRQSFLKTVYLNFQKAHFRGRAAEYVYVCEAVCEAGLN